MSSSCHQLFLHLVWSTNGRLPLLPREVRSQVYAVLAHKCNEKECHPIAIGGTEDHVHVLVEVDPKVSPANLVQELKGISSHLMTHKVRPGEPFKWQAGYGAFSVSKRHVPQIKAYIENQERHHREGTVFEELERDK